MSKLDINVREVMNGYIVYPPANPSTNYGTSAQNHVASTIPDLLKLVEKLAKEAKSKQAE